MDKNLGRGNFGEAWLSTIPENKKEKYGKEIDKVVVKFEKRKPQSGMSMRQEFALMSRNNHPNIVKFLDFIEDCNALIMEVNKTFIF